jgi:NADPH-dependent glutamate synthase beta subunit-like oxidoreductase
MKGADLLYSASKKRGTRGCSRASGPAGYAALELLVLMQLSVNVFENSDRVGGALSMGFQAFWFPKSCSAFWSVCSLQLE